MESAEKKIQKLEEELNQALIERSEEIRALLVALLSDSHILLLGPPGTAKSMLANMLCGSIKEANFFKHLMMKTTVPEEIFGPFSLKGLKEDRYLRITKKKLPEAHVAFIDECWKCNSTTLNAMLNILNERVFDNDGQEKKVPLLTCVGASNELPQGEELGALYDRFLIRFWVQPIQDDSSFCDLLQNKIGSGPKTQLTLHEIKQLRKEVCKIPVSREITETMRTIYHELSAKGIQGSDRRWKSAVKVMKANAFLSGSQEVTDDDLEILTHIMWDNPEDRKKVQDVVLPKSNPLNQKAVRYLDQAKEVFDQWKKIPESNSEKGSQTLETNGILLEIVKKIKSDIKNIPEVKTKKLLQTKQQIQAMRKTVVTSLKIDDE